MVRCVRVFAGTVLLAVSAAAPLLANEFPQADAYFAVRDRSRVVAAHPDQVALRPTAYRGQLIEVRGAISGNARREGGVTFILTTPAQVTYVIDASPAQEQEVAIGHTVRVLAQVRDESAGSAGAADRAEGGESTSAGGAQLVLVAVTSEYEAAELEALRARRAAAARMAGATRSSAGSARRGVRTRGQRMRYAKQLASRSLSILAQYRDAVLYFNPRLYPDQAERIARSIIAYSNAYGLDARLVMAVIAAESNFNASAVSRKGAMGLGQLMPGTAMGLGVRNPWNPEDNIAGATRLLRGHLERMRQGPQLAAAGVVTEDQLKLALACYNAGLGAVKKYGGVPPYRETKRYVAKVTRLYRQMCGVEP
jgi:soluble lytic murein transglycosylase-like protein